MFLSKISLTLAFGILLIKVAKAIPVSGESHFLIQNVAIRSHECANQGDSDVYGLGVRVGLYLQWLAGFILRNIGSWDTMTRVRTANNALCIALALAEAIKVVDGKALAIDYLLSYYLTVILFYSESYRIRLKVGETIPIFEHRDLLTKASEVRESKEMKHKIKSYTLVPDLSLIFQNVFFAAYTLFGAWFWLRGINQIPESTCSEYAAIVLIFHLRNKSWQTAATVFAILLGIFWAIVFAINFSLFTPAKGKNPGPVIISTYRVLHFFRFQSARTEFMPEETERVPQPQEIGARFKRPVSRNFFHYIWLNLLGPFVAIISVERIISSNKLSTSDVSGSTGQMISLVTGITSALCAFWELGMWLQKEEDVTTKRSDSANTSDPSVPDSKDLANTCQPSSKDQSLQRNEPQLTRKRKTDA
ncbi:hypothetical protein N7466_009397 [Penicillium verhagenii]|uniref:uncharacterized protein n=1 Tax=Penicillium verhagenii TaxID=1562060 RepID=UPI002545986A|nr:uncharacterized protein N7466_009397 [Penicillium verhagenii]KAJ5921071.1 hypothetical protein N7466_009397 [Penicillium verhagenii]